jgi:uncharacterized phosphatase
MILAMVRHGQTAYNAKRLVQGRVNNALNDTGKKQALDLSSVLLKKNEVFDRVLSSPLSRALETAFIINQALNIGKPIFIVPNFTERDFNLLDGVGVDEAMSLIRQKDYTHDGYEMDKQLIYRVVNATLQLTKDFKNQTLLAVAHSHVIKALLVYVDPIRFSFTDYILNNGEIVYFEINNNQIKFISHEK